MKVHFEARLTSDAGGVIELDGSELEEYNGLTSDEDREEFLQYLVAEVAHDKIYETRVETVDWRVEED